MDSTYARVLSVMSLLMLVAEGSSRQVQATGEVQAVDLLDAQVPLPLAAAPPPPAPPSAWRLLRKRDIRTQLWGPKAKDNRTAKKSPSRPKSHRTNSLGELRDDLMVHGRDRDQLKRRWKIEDGNNRVANVHG